MTVKELADLEGVTKTSIRKTIDKLNMWDQLQTVAGVLQLTDEQAENIRAYRHRNDPDTGAETGNQEPQPIAEPVSANRNHEAETGCANHAAEAQTCSGNRNPESETYTANPDTGAETSTAMTALLQQLESKDRQIERLLQQLEAKDQQIQSLTAALTALAVSGGPKLLEEDNQHKGRFRRALAGLFNR